MFHHVETCSELCFYWQIHHGSHILFVGETWGIHVERAIATSSREATVRSISLKFADSATLELFVSSHETIAVGISLATQITLVGEYVLRLL